MRKIFSDTSHTRQMTHINCNFQIFEDIFYLNYNLKNQLMVS